MKFGKRIIAALEDLRDSIRDEKPIKQSIVRRMTVKGNTVYTRETYTTPVNQKNNRSE